MAQSQELDAASRSSETYLAENGGGRPASVQPRSCIRVQEGTRQNYLAGVHSRERLRHRQAPNDDDDELAWAYARKTDWKSWSSVINFKG